MARDVNRYNGYDGYDGYEESMKFTVSLFLVFSTLVGRNCLSWGSHVARSDVLKVSYQTIQNMQLPLMDGTLYR